MAVDLVFSNQPLTGPAWDLVFGEAEGAGVIPSRSFTLSAPLPPLTVALHLADYKHFEIAATLPPLTVAMLCAYDVRAVRNREGSARAAHQEAARPRPSVGGAWGLSASKRGGTDAGWQDAAPVERGTDMPSSVARQVRPEHGAGWQGGQAREFGTGARHQRGLPRRATAASAWQLGQQRRRSVGSGMQTGLNRRYVLEDSDWQRARFIHRAWAAPIGASLRYRERDATARYQQAWLARGGRMSDPVAPPFDPCYLPDTGLLFDAPWSASPNLVFFCERHPGGGPGEEPGAVVVVPIQRVYIVLNEASLRRVDGNIPLPTFSMTMGLSRGSWAWDFSATLPAEALPNLEPASDGAPVEVEASVNGAVYRMLVERCTRTRTFGKASIAIAGRSINALLDAPHALAMSFENIVARTAQQLMNDVLTDNGESIGWSVDWGLTDWLVPANVFSHQGSYITALNAIAGAVGGYVQPHNSAKTLRVLPGYPALPWEWGAVAPDFELPADVTTQESIERVSKARYNRVFVSGTKSGVLGQVSRAGTAGDRVAQMVTDPLITHADAARQRGGAVLSDTGRQENVGLRLPVLPETGIILPGKFTRYVDGAESRTGLVRDVRVDVGEVEVWQSLSVETHV